MQIKNSTANLHKILVNTKYCSSYNKKFPESKGASRDFWISVIG